MYRFDYHRATSVTDAASRLAAAPEAKLLAGGMSLVPVMKQRLAGPSDLIDLNAIAALRGIAVEPGRVTVGAMTTHATVAASAEIARAIPALSKLAGGIGDPHVRNRGTIGGSLANNDPAACYPSAVLGLGASVRTDRREIAADDFFLGLFQTALQPGEIITAVGFPVPDYAEYVKFANMASRFSIVGVFLARFDTRVRVAVTGAGPCVFRVRAFEDALAVRFEPEILDPLEVSSRGLNNDIHADPEYRAHLIKVLTQRAVGAETSSRRK